MTTIGSLFSGIGGLEKGLERATGARTIWQVERDPFCQRVLAKHWPEATRHDDVTTARALPFVDVICGGFPCQDISLAGLGAGITGARSGLWSHFHRIVDEHQPRIVVVENVAALAARGLSRVLQDLADLGFVGTWDVVSAASVGAPHRRRRLFVVAAHPDRVNVREQSWWRSGQVWARARVSRDACQDGDAADAERTRLEGAAGPRIHGAPRQQGLTACRGCSNAADASVSRCEGIRCEPIRAGEAHAQPDLSGGWCGWQPSSAVRRMDDGLPAGLDRPRRRRPANDKHRLHALGNAVVPQVAEVIGHVVKEILAC